METSLLENRSKLRNIFADLHMIITGKSFSVERVIKQRGENRKNIDLKYNNICNIFLYRTFACSSPFIFFQILISISWWRSRRVVSSLSLLLFWANKDTLLQIKTKVSRQYFQHVTSKAYLNCNISAKSIITLVISKSLC